MLLVVSSIDYPGLLSRRSGQYDQYARRLFVLRGLKGCLRRRNVNRIGNQHRLTNDGLLSGLWFPYPLYLFLSLSLYLSHSLYRPLSLLLFLFLFLLLLLFLFHLFLLSVFHLFLLFFFFFDGFGFRKGRLKWILSFTSNAIWAGVLVNRIFLSVFGAIFWWFSQLRASS